MVGQDRTEPRMMTGVVILMLASLFEKILGVLFKIPLYSSLGNVGMGYFNAADSIFSTFYTISLTGFPIAVSIMVSKSRARGRIIEVNKTFRVALAVFFTIGLIGSSIMFFGADLIANIIDSENNSSLCVKAISPILLIICISGSIKGYFQGHKNMMPTAVSEFLDALGKCALGVILALWSAGKGYSVEICAAYAIAGVTLGHLLGLGFLTVFKFASKPKPIENESAESDGYKKLIRTLFVIAIPITFSSVALGLTANIDTFTIMNCLKSPDAMAKYGEYTTLAVTLFRLPQAFILPISAALTPTLSAAISAKNAEKAHRAITSSLKLTSVIAMSCMFGMSVLSYPIIFLLFGNGNSEKSIAGTAPLLSILSVGIVFIAFLTVTSSILQAHKLEKKPVIAAFFGALTKLVLNIVLVSTVGMIGAPISSVVGYFVMAAVNFYFVIKYVTNDLKIGKTIGKVVLSSLIMAAFALGVYLILYNFTSSPRISVVVAVPLAAIFYVFMLFITKSVEKDDILMLPKGEKIYSILKKINFVK